jgi:hypothetical protein
VLAGESDANLNPFEIKDLFNRILIEIGLPMPSKDEAAHILICYWVRHIVDGSVSPREGAYHILNDIHRRTTYPNEKILGETLDISSLLGMAYQYDDLQDGFIEYEGKPISLEDALILLDKDVAEESRKYLQKYCTE